MANGVQSDENDLWTERTHVGNKERLWHVLTILWFEIQANINKRTRIHMADML